MKLTRIIEEIEREIPLDLQEEWDNCGLQLGDRKKDVHGILLALDSDPDVVRYAVKNNCNLILNHHPILFKPLSNLDYEKPTVETLVSAIRAEIAIYAAHTNLDILPGGVNDILAQTIGFPLPYILEETQCGVGMGRVGEINPVTVHQLIQQIKDRLNLNHLIYYGDPNTTVRKLAVAGGAGSFLIDQAIKQKADILITADIKYHEAQHALESGLSLIDLGHYTSEVPVIQKLGEIARKIVGEEIPIIQYPGSEIRKII